MLTPPEIFEQKPQLIPVEVDDVSAEKRKKVEEYEKQKFHYKEKYADTLDSPNPELKVSIVVPSLAELTNDNFWKLLRSLMY